MQTALHFIQHACSYVKRRSKEFNYKAKEQIRIKTEELISTKRRMEMNHLQKVGGIAAIVHSAAYLIAIGLYISVMSPIMDASPEQYLVLLADYKDLMIIWILIAYLVAGVCLVPVSLALYERLKTASPALIQTSTVLGFIWAALIIGSGNLMIHGFEEIASLYARNPAQAETAYVTLKIVETGIVSANELTGGLWILLLSWAALKIGELNKALNSLGMAIGAVGVLTLVPPLAEITKMLFGPGMIVWFAWAGIVLLRRRAATAS